MCSGGALGIVTFLEGNLEATADFLASLDFGRPLEVDDLAVFDGLVGISVSYANSSSDVSSATAFRLID